MSRNSSALSAARLTLPLRSWVEIDHAALSHNLEVIRKLAGDAGIMAIVKANAYGHGLNEVATTLRKGIAIFAVASLGEALQLHKTEKSKPILLLSAALPNEYPEIARHGFIPTISSIEEALAFSQAASRVKKKPSYLPQIHFKIDTGMGRLGADPSEAYKILQSITKMPLILHSISTHLPCADSNTALTKVQLKRFEVILAELQPLVSGIPVHALNSAGAILHPDHTRDFVRIGLLLYGVSPLPKLQNLLKPVLSWKAAVTFVHNLPKGHGISYGSSFITSRNMKVAVLPAGYADGYPRQLSGRGAAVLLNGKRCPLLGRVTMDQIIVDVSRAGKIKIGDEAVLVGTQLGKSITATEVATRSETIPWHLFCGITARVTYLHNNY